MESVLSEPPCFSDSLCWTYTKTVLWHRNILVNYFCILKPTGLSRMNRIININCCSLVDFRYPQCSLLSVLLAPVWVHCFAFCRKQLRRRSKEPNVSIFGLRWIWPRGTWPWTGTWWRKVQVHPAVRGKDPFSYFLTASWLDLSCNISYIPRGFARLLLERSHFGVVPPPDLHVIIFNLFDTCHFTPRFTNPSTKITFFVCLIYYC